MAKLRLLDAIVFYSAISWGPMAAAQMPLPAPKPPDGATLFKQQCATCHTVDPVEPIRQGPPLAKIVDRPAGKIDGFHYSPGARKGRLRLERGEARRLADQSSSGNTGCIHGLQAGQAGNACGNHRLFERT